MNKKIMVAFAFLAALALYQAPWSATAQPQPSLLFVQSAKKIDYKDGVMTLYGIPNQTLFFTDRPGRVVGNMPMTKFVAKWTTDRGPNGFAANPPNAAVTIFHPDSVKTAIVELRNPRLDGDKLAYDVKVLQGIASTTPGEGVLFIDNYTGWAAAA